MQINGNSTFSGSLITKNSRRIRTISTAIRYYTLRSLNLGDKLRAEFKPTKIWKDSPESKLKILCKHTP